MNIFIEYLKAFFIGALQGITEWLPISSTGHMILFDEFFSLDVSPEFLDMFLVVIQFGSILAVVFLYFKRLWPFFLSASKAERKAVWELWLKIIIAAVPAGIVGLLFEDFFDTYFYNSWVVAAALIVYGAVFIVLERRKSTTENTGSAEDITNASAFKIGAFQILALIPGTSRSGSTILGARLLGINRPAAAEFSFFLAIPMMAGASFLKIVKYVFEGNVPSPTETGYLVIGIVTAFIVSVFAIKFFVGFVRRHSFEAFGWYRIILGVAVLGYFAVKAFI